MVLHQHSLLTSHRNMVIFITGDATSDWAASGVDNNDTLRTAFLGRIDGSGICPTGFNVLTEDELQADTTHDDNYVGSNDITNLATAFSNFLKIPVAGNRAFSGQIADVNSIALLRSRTIGSNNNSSRVLLVFGIAANNSDNPHVAGISVRCIRALN